MKLRSILLGLSEASQLPEFIPMADAALEMEAVVRLGIMRAPAKGLAKEFVEICPVEDFNLRQSRQMIAVTSFGDSERRFVPGVASGEVDFTVTAHAIHMAEEALTGSIMGEVMTVAVSLGGQDMEVDVHVTQWSMNSNSFTVDVRGKVRGAPRVASRAKVRKVKEGGRRAIKLTGDIGD
jgi:hypothetical protein